jgi:peptide/nickel transport system substrate-binding protein
VDPKWVRLIAVVIVVVVVAAGVTGYYFLTRTSPTCHLASTDPIIVDQAETPDSLDPAVTFSTPGWAAVQQVYHGMVNYNGTSYTTFLPDLAQNWSTSADGLHWNFTLRQGVHFSNGDSYNAYVEWYSLYRDLIMAQASVFILTQNFYVPGLNYYSNLTLLNAENATLTNQLNTFNFFNPTPAQIAVMNATNQSFRVLGPYEIQLNLGFGYLGLAPYGYLLASISAPNSYAVDPAVVDANGGVTAGSPNPYLNDHMVGTGPYTLFAYNPATGYTVKPDPNFWGTQTGAAGREPWNNLIQPALHSVQVDFQEQSAINVQDLQTGAVAEASFAYLGPSTIHQLQGLSCIVVQALPTVFGATGGSWWIYMNENTHPFDNLSVRAAVAHAIDYSTILQQAFGGYATQWVGPVPPGYPDYNPASLPAYSYNLTQARQEMNNSPYPLHFGPGGMTGGFSGTLNYLYITPSQDWATMASILQTDLAQIGININPVGITLTQLYEEQSLDSSGACIAQTSANGGPFPIGQEFYTSDYISPDDWTQNNAISYGSANLCMSAYANSNVDNWTLQAAATPTTNTAALTQLYTNITRTMYNDYVDAWIVVPTAFAVYSTLLHGFIENPMASGEPYTLGFNTQYVS